MHAKCFHSFAALASSTLLLPPAADIAEFSKHTAGIASY